MSKIFYDHLVILEKIDFQIKNISQSPEEKQELWDLVDRIINHRMMITILDRLPRQYHEEFLMQFSEAPHSETHIDYLNSRIDFLDEENKIEEVIEKETKLLEKELLEEIHSLQKG